jgi:hypothetical protein
MTRVIVSEDCGNSPKNIFVQEFTVAMIKGDTKFLLQSVVDEIRWNVTGDKVIHGKDHVIRALEERKNDPALELTIQHIATHGKTGAVDGQIKFKGGKTHAFCNVYAFSNSKGNCVKEITSYIIEVK